MSSIDNPFVNPFVEKYDLDRKYLAFEKSVREKTDSEQGNDLFIVIFLSDTLHIRSRQVYNSIEFISEISGFADILMISAGFFLAWYGAKR